MITINYASKTFAMDLPMFDSLLWLKSHNLPKATKGALHLTNPVGCTTYKSHASSKLRLSKFSFIIYFWEKKMWFSFYLFRVEFCMYSTTKWLSQTSVIRNTKWLFYRCPYWSDCFSRKKEEKRCGQWKQKPLQLNAMHCKSQSIFFPLFSSM